MDMVNIKPAMLHGEVRIPPSKSIAHRAVIAAFLSKGKCCIENIDLSEDISATVGCIKAMGANCKYNKKSRTLEVSCEKLKSTTRRITLDCGESGSTLRFFIPIALALGFKCNFTGRGRLMQRPMEPYMKVFEAKGVRYKFENEVLTTDGQLTAGQYVIDGSLSSQFVTGLLFALSTLSEDSEIVIEGETVSKGYIDLTLATMSDFGIEIENNGYKSFIIKGSQKYNVQDYSVEGDFSQAAFFLVAGAIGCDVVCTGMNPKSIQGDKEILNVLRMAGAEVEVSDDGRICAKRGSDMHGITVDAGEIPDLVPIMAVLMSFCRGESNIVNAGRLRIKESDRLRAISSELRHLGVDITEGPDYLKIVGRQVISGTTVSAWNDHRIAMSMAIAACRSEGDVGITGAETAVKKSYPHFFEDYKSLGGTVINRK